MSASGCARPEVRVELCLTAQQGGCLLTCSASLKTSGRMPATGMRRVCRMARLTKQNMSVV